jgi:predicted membrane-bound spermidine synthase
MKHILRRVQEYQLLAIAFGVGFGLMAYELVAARILAPTLGSSTYVWTSVIGIIIAALALGFYAGGRLADARNTRSDIAWLLLLVAAAITYTLVSYDGTLSAIANTAIDSRVQGVLAAVLLFAPASFFVGVVSPYLTKINVTSLRTTGRAVASLDMSNSLGGIVGTFVTGFILFGYIGSRETLIALVIVFIGLSWAVAPRTLVVYRVMVSVILGGLAVATLSSDRGISVDTPSAHYEVIQTSYNGAPIIGLATGPGGIQSAVYRDNPDDLVFWYTNELAKQTIQRKPESVLLLGGGAVTLPQYLGEHLPDTTIDVVEIDPELMPLSEKYFGYTAPKNVHHIFEDARVYSNQTDKTYDVILVDVYGDASIPFSLITSEYARALSERLNPGGRVIANIIAGERGACRDILTSINASYGVYLPGVQYRTGVRTPYRTNYVVIYEKEYTPESGYTRATRLDVPYTDNFAPAERLYFSCERQPM